MEEWGMAASRMLLSLLAVAVIALSSLSLVPENCQAPYDEPVIVATDRDVYVAGETVQINVSVVGPFSASFSSSCQCFFVVEDALGNVVYDLRLHSYWFSILTKLNVPYGTTKVFQFTWNQRDDAGNVVPVPGSYEIWGYIAGWNPMDNPVAGDSKLISIGKEMVYELQLVAGWNLFSLPLLAYYTASSLGLPNRSVVAGWNSTTQAYDETYIVGKSPPFKDFVIVEGMGYWIFVSSAFTLLIEGGTLTTTHYYLWTAPSGGGWVLVGLPKTSGTLYAHQIPGWCDHPESIILVARYNAETMSYQTYKVGLPFTDFRLVPGEGFWVFLNQTVTVAYGPPRGLVPTSTTPN